MSSAKYLAREMKGNDVYHRVTGDVGEKGG